MSMLILSWQYKYLVPFWPNRKWKHKSCYVDITEIPQRGFNGELIEKELHWTEHVFLKGRIFFLFPVLQNLLFPSNVWRIGWVESNQCSYSDENSGGERTNNQYFGKQRFRFRRDQMKLCIFFQTISKSFLVLTLILTDFSFLKLLSSQGHFLWASKQAQWKLRKCFWMKISMHYSISNVRRRHIDVVLMLSKHRNNLKRNGIVYSSMVD